MVSQRGSSYAALLALVGAAILTSAYADGLAYDIVSKSPAHAGVGPGGFTVTTKWDDSNKFLSKGPISRVAFLAKTDGRSGLSVWYDTTQVDHGMALNDDYSEQIKEQITTVTLYFTESIGSTPGAFTSMMFQTKSGKQYQFGSYNGKAKTATFNAPYNGFLAALAGTSTTDRLVTLQIIWGKTQAPASGTVKVAGSTVMIGARTRNGTKAFDDTNAALKQGRLSRVSYLFDPAFNALSLTYGQFVVGHGAKQQVNTSHASVPITSPIVRVQGVYTQGDYGYFASMTFMATNGFTVTIGQNYTGTNAKTFDAIAPKNAYLGAIKGYATANAVHQIAFVWFTNSAR